jgi:nucleoside-diphosphate-sugar epimerase
MSGLRVVVTGGTGNVGTSLVQALARDPAVGEVVALARRATAFPDAGVRFAQVDVVRDDLEAVFRGADAVVHLAWLIQPSHDGAQLRAVNVDGSRRVFDAAVRAGVGTIVHASSVGAYSPGPDDRRVDESWPTNGVPTLFYSRHKAECERMLDALEAEHPGVRVVRLRPGLIFKRAAATGIRRLFAGPFLPGGVLRAPFIPVVPDPGGLRFQAVHTEDVADAYRRAVLGDVRGAFNVAAEPVLGPADAARLLGARTVPVAPRIVRAAADLTWRLRLQPTPPGWLDMGLAVPTMDIGRARAELGWEAARTSLEALEELLGGLRDGADHPTPPLDAATSGPARVRELHRAAQP